MTINPKVEIAGENALLVSFGDDIDPALLARVQHLSTALDTEAPRWLVDMIPSYASLLVVFDPVCIDRVTLRRHLLQVASDPAADEFTVAGARVELPVYYSEESGPDLTRIARHTGLDPEEIVARHRNTEYRVYALGFAPGFAYLGQVQEALATPRLATPRQRIPRGAVAIADRQTAIYPTPTPGGWNLIGLCPETLFIPERQPPTLWRVGDRVRFRAIDRDEFLALGGELP